jgi:di/tricarboxylate transporter
MIAAACAAATSVTNVMANVAASGILVSALSCTGPAHGVHPLFVLAPVAMASSYAFLLPIGDRHI